MTDFLGELFSLKGRVAVITGGSSGIGEAMASALAHAGAQVVLVARDPTRLSAASASLCGPAARRPGSAPTSLTGPRSSGPVGRRRNVRRPDILVNCAGVNLRPPLAAMSEDHWGLMVPVNLTAPFLLGQRFGPAMAARGWGRIINVTSQQAHRAFGNSGGYGATKAGLAALTRSSPRPGRPQE